MWATVKILPNSIHLHNGETEYVKEYVCMYVNIYIYIYISTKLFAHKFLKCSIQ